MLPDFFLALYSLYIIEKSYRKKNQDNIGEVIVTRKFVYYGDKITYNKEEGIVRIKCRKCNKKYMTQTNGAHILPRTAPEYEKKNGNSIYIVESVGLKIIGTKNLI